MQALGEPSSLQCLWVFASAVGFLHENWFVVGVEELGEPLRFPSCFVDWAMREETGPELVLAAVAGEKVLWCQSCEALG